MTRSRQSRASIRLMSTRPLRRKDQTTAKTWTTRVIAVRTTRALLTTLATNPCGMTRCPTTRHCSPSASVSDKTRSHAVSSASLRARLSPKNLKSTSIMRPTRPRTASNCRKGSGSTRATLAIAQRNKRKKQSRLTRVASRRLGNMSSKGH